MGVELKTKAMKDRKQIGLNRIVILLFVTLIIISSCKKEDEDNTGYYGKWMAGKAVPSTGGFAKVNYYLTLSNPNRFNESFFIYTQGIKYVSIDGSISVLENNMEFNAEKISFSNYDVQKEKLDPPYYVITNDQEIETALHSLVKVTSGHNAEFSLNGNKLTLIVDYDENGNSLDYDEILIYTRQ